MDTFLKILLYSSLVLAFLASLAWGFVMAGKWLVDSSVEPEGEA